MTRGRKRGLAAVLGFQRMAQLRRIYGHEQAAVLASMPSTKLILRVDESETAAFLARQIGERETLHEELGMSAGQDDHRFSIHPARRIEAVVMAAEIQRCRSSKATSASPDSTAPESESSLARRKDASASSSRGLSGSPPRRRPPPIR